MKSWSLLAILFFAIACSNNKNDKDNPAKDNASGGMPGADEDDHGCKTSAGYRWSKLKDKCIRVFEEGIKLNTQQAVADKTTAAFIVFSSNNNQAELFLPAEKFSFILTREGASWTKDDWVLETGYVLKKSGVVQYAQ